MRQGLTLSQVAVILAAVLLPSTHMGANGSLKRSVTPVLGDPVLSSVLCRTGYQLIMYVGVCFCICTYMEVPAEARGNGSSGTGIMIGCELPDVGAGNRTWAHWS